MCLIIISVTFKSQHEDLNSVSKREEKYSDWEVMNFLFIYLFIIFIYLCNLTVVKFKYIGSILQSAK